MPVSHHFNRQSIAQLVSTYQCKTVLDIGIGYGNIGAYLKQCFPLLIIDGIEIWAPYANSQWRNYRRIWLADFCTFPLEPVYDAILAIDVIEHLTKDVGKYQISRLIKLAQKVFILSIPIIEYPQGAWGGNPYEIHRSDWREAEILAMGLKLVAKNEIIGVFFSPI